MKISEFKRWLEANGVKVEEGTRHWKLTRHGHISFLKRHPSAEIEPFYVKAILKQLGFK